jgi:hypothetical protein
MSNSLPEVSELERKWANSECQDCPNGDKNLWLIAGRPCTFKKRIVMKGGFCVVTHEVRGKTVRIKETGEQT